MKRLSINQIKELNNIGNGSVKSVYDMKNGYIIAIPRALTEHNKKYNIKVQKHYHSINQIYRTLSNIYDINERYAFYSMIIEFFIWEQIQIISKKYKIKTNIFLPITTLYFNKNNVPIIIRPKVDKVGHYNDMVEQENKQEVEYIITTINKELKRKFNVEIITRDIYDNIGNCGKYNNQFMIIDYGLCSGIETPFN